MKTRVLDADTFRQLTVADTVSWLKATGWTPVKEEQERFVRFTRSVEEGIVEVEVPRRANLRDFALRMAEVVDIAATVENRSQSEIVQDIRQAGVDTLRLRFDGAAARVGRVTADDGARLYQSVRDLLLAGACATVEKRALFAKRKPDQAMSFLRHAWFVPPEPGSFTVVVESPVIPHLQHQRSLFAEDPEPPFERRVMQMLVVSLNAVVQAANEASVSQELEPFVRAIDQGVTANLCEALVGLLSSVDGSTLDASLSWARNRPLPHAVPATPVRVLPDSLPVLEAVAREFRAREPLPDFELRGPILELASDNPDHGGTLTIGGAVENRVVKVRVQADRDTYHRALNAHEQKHVVLVDGELVRKGRSYTLLNPRNFSVESDE